MCLMLCSFFGLGERRTKEERFWEWFAQHSRELIRVSTGKESICSELVRQLRKVDKGLVYAMGLTVEDGRREFIVSADGIRSVFPAVKRLVKVAPDLPGWRIIAFRPGGIVDMTMKVGARDLGPDDLWFRACDREGVVVLDLYIRDYSETTAKPLGQAAFLLVDYALGEYDVETKLGALEFKPLPTDPVAEGLKPFRELPHTIHELTAIRS